MPAASVFLAVPGFPGGGQGILFDGIEVLYNGRGRYSAFAYPTGVGFATQIASWARGYEEKVWIWTIVVLL